MSFKEQGYQVVRNFIEQDDTERLYKHTLETSKDWTINDNQVMNTPSTYNDKKLMKLHYDMIGKMEWLTGLELHKTYCYARMYKIGDRLRPHTDRPACEISATITLGMEYYNWEIWIFDYSDTIHKVTLYPGDALIYRGCDLLHWRSENKFAVDYSQVFLHYVDKRGPNAWAKDDIQK